MGRRPIKKRRVTKRRAVGKVYKKSGVSRGMSMHSFSRMKNTSQILTLSNNTAYANGSFTFALNDLTNYTEFTNLFDQYKITKVQIEFKMHTNPYILYSTQPVGGAQAAAPITFPTIYLVNDHDDATALTLAEFKERQSVRRFVLAPNKIIKWSVKPAILNQLYRTAVSTAYAPKYGQFIDCAQADVPHYGVKWGIDYDGATLPQILAGPYGQDITVGVEMRYWFTTKDVR